MSNVLILSSILLWIVVLFNLLLTVALIRRGNATQSGFDMENVETLEIGSQAPDFTAVTLDGKNVTLADFTGTSIAFIFMSPSCLPCVEKLPLINALAPEAKNSGVQLILIMLSQLVEAKVFVEQHSVSVPVVVASQNSNYNYFVDNYKVTGTPFYCLLDKNNRVQSSGLFGSDWNELTKQWLSAN